jgi:hypothetical protein
MERDLEMEKRNPLKQKWHPHTVYAEAIGKSERTVRDWCNQGLLKFSKIGGARLIHEDDWEEGIRHLARGGNRSGR